MRHVWKQVLNDSKCGTTMVEVIVAFTILILIMGIFSQALGMTGRMMNRADDVLVGYRNLAGEYYLKENPGAESRTEKNLTFYCTKSGESFSVKAGVGVYSNAAGSIYDVTAPE